jgi:hypothetical protein
MKFEWEQIDDWHQRAKVPSGWLVKAFEDVTHNMLDAGRGMETGYDLRVTMCFVPDEGHCWKVDK